jgi:hypothetical protein
MSSTDLLSFSLRDLQKKKDEVSAERSALTHEIAQELDCLIPSAELKAISILGKKYRQILEDVSDDWGFLF